jgi:hypothetical protein
METKTKNSATGHTWNSSHRGTLDHRKWRVTVQLLSTLEWAKTCQIHKTAHKAAGEMNKLKLPI